MNKELLKMLIIVAVLALLIAIVYSFAHFFYGGMSSTATSTNPFGQPDLVGGNGTGPGSSNGIQIKNKDGEVFTVQDFTAGHQAIKENSGTYYYLTQDSKGTDQSDEYGIVYGTDSSISIGLFSEPLGASRLHAEIALRRLIPITDAQFCTLDITVMTPPSVNEQYAAEDLGLSFCPGSVKLP